MAQTNIIELNGKRYDAKTGAMLGHAPGGNAAHHSTQLKAHHGRTIDGVMRPSQHAAHSNAAKAHNTHAASTPKAPQPPPKLHADVLPPTKLRTSHATLKPISAHQPEKSKILMRHAVHKPDFKLKPAIKTQAPAEVMAKPIGTIVPKASAYQLDVQRLHRAKSVPRSPSVGRFAPSVMSSVARPASSVAARPTHRPNYATHPTRPAAAHLARPASHEAAIHSRSTPISETDMFEKAISEATSHTQPSPKVKHRRQHRWLRLGAAVVVVLALSGAVLWTNRINIAVHIASARVGFSVTLPSYTPDGYTLSSGVQASNGKVTLSFRSGSAQYTLTQQASSWDSNTLRDNVVGLATGTPQTLEAAGRTVYLYGNGNATWVDGGKRYNLTTNNSLTPAEITNLAASI